MKKILFLMLAAFAVVSCNDDCDHNYSGSQVIPISEGIAGSWYEEEENEEMRFSPSGTFYDKYCNTERSFETEGRYELSADNRKLTYNYNFMGQTQFADWTISNRDELSFMITSDKVGSHVLEKIVETYNMTDGKTQQILFASEHPNYTVQSRIASVSESGLITTNGEKGTAYIKITTNNGNAWAKVVVGDECLDLWYDYISLIGQNLSQVRATLGNPHQNDGNQGYFYALDFHDVVKQVGLWLNSDTRTVETFNLILKEGVPSETVLTYLESRYYKYKETGRSVQYLNNSTIENSIAVIEYNPDAGIIIISDINSYFDLWPEYTSAFGMTLDELVVNYGNLYYGILPLYTVENDYIESVYFEVDDNTGKTKAYVLYLNTGYNVQEIHDYLSSKYTHYGTNEENSMYAYCDGPTRNESKLQIVFNYAKGAITYFDIKAYENANASTTRSIIKLMEMPIMERPTF